MSAIVPIAIVPISAAARGSRPCECSGFQATSANLIAATQRGGLGLACAVMTSTKFWDVDPDSQQHTAGAVHNVMIERGILRRSHRSLLTDNRTQRSARFVHSRSASPRVSHEHTR
jgi:hypothetical protein